MRKKTEKPNVILVLCDDLGYGDLECYGSEKNKTPAINKIAEEGIIFTDFHVNSPVCSPSRAGIMTGCYPQRVGLGQGESFCVLLPGDSIGINPEEVTIPKMFKEAGYTTKIIGKWHLGDQKPFLPINNGFDSFFGLPYSNDMAHYHPHLNVMFPPLPLIENDEIIGKDPKQGLLSERYISESKLFIEENADKPFFLYLSHMYVHWPFYPPKSFLKSSKGDKYRAEVEFIDWGMSEINDSLEKKGILENTLIVFTSDNGGVSRYGSNAPLRGQKGDIYEGGMRVPCLMSWPSVIESGRKSEMMASTMDLLPTFARLAGVKLDKSHVVDGSDISQYLFGNNKIQEDRILCYYRENKIRAIRKGPWKYFLKTNELFNLKTDVGETNNIVKGNEEKVKELLEIASQFRLKLGDGELIGTEVRNCGKVENPKMLFEIDELSIYTAEYD